MSDEHFTDPYYWADPAKAEELLFHIQQQTEDIAAFDASAKNKKLAPAKRRLARKTKRELEEFRDQLRAQLPTRLIDERKAIINILQRLESEAGTWRTTWLPKFMEMIQENIGNAVWHSDDIIEMEERERLLRELQESWINRLARDGTTLAVLADHLEWMLARWQEDVFNSAAVSTERGLGVYVAQARLRAKAKLIKDRSFSFMYDVGRYLKEWQAQQEPEEARIAREILAEGRLHPLAPDERRSLLTKVIDTMRQSGSLVSDVSTPDLVAGIMAGIPERAMQDDFARATEEE